ncbi:MAG TPA: kelch repeat-containing protein, partial [Burkholderiaceae bacterium]
LPSSITPDLLHATYFAADKPSVAHYLREASYGKAWATGRVFDPVVIADTNQHNPYLVRDAAIQAVSARHDLRPYNRIVLVAPQSAGGLHGSGEGTTVFEDIKLADGGTIRATTSWLGDISAGSPTSLFKTAIHEMGHNLGLGHARSADFGAEPIGPVGQPPRQTPGEAEYGDPYSSMGKVRAQWSAQHKAALGWLQAGNDLAEVEADGTYTLQPYEAATSATKALRVRRGTGNNAWLWIEFRQPLGLYDVTAPGPWNESDISWDAPEGALIHYDDPAWKDGTNATALVRFDTHPRFLTSTLKPGSTWTDPYTNLRLTVEADKPGSLKIKVSYASQQSALRLSMPASVDGAARTVSATVAAPAGKAWTASSSQPWAHIAGGAGSGDGNFNIELDANPGTEVRWTKIQAGDTYAILTQSGTKGAITLSADTAFFPAAGGNGQLTVTATAQDYVYPLIADFISRERWISNWFLPNLFPVGTQTLTYTVSENISDQPRSTTVIFDGKVYTIKQAAGRPASAALQFELLALPDAPTARMGAAMTGFTAAGEAILYGGQFGATRLEDTWGWNGKQWTRKQPAHSPGPLSYHAMAYDELRKQVVMYGGGAGDSSYGTGSGATWIWDGSDWTKAHSAVQPPDLWRPAMAYNPKTGTVLMFGDDARTWEWNGSAWRALADAAGPRPRSAAAMSYDPARQEIVLFGGLYYERATDRMEILNDTWTWDGQRWTQRFPLDTPTPRRGAKLVYDPQLGKSVMFGGEAFGPRPGTFGWVRINEETWLWDGENWTQQFTEKRPEFSYDYGAGYDPVNRNLFVYVVDDAHCADPGPKMYAMRPGPAAITLDRYRSEAGAGRASGTVAIDGQLSWTATADSWIKLQASAGSGGTLLGFEVDPNPTALPRTGVIRIGDARHVVSQAAGQPAPR